MNSNPIFLGTCAFIIVIALYESIALLCHKPYAQKTIKNFDHKNIKKVVNDLDILQLDKPSCQCTDTQNHSDTDRLEKW